MSSLKDFLRWYNKKHFVPTLEAMQKRWLFIMTKLPIWSSLLVHYQTWPTFDYTNLYIQNSIHSRKELKIFWKKVEKILLVVHLSFLQAKQLLMKFLFEIPQTYANLQFGLMPANYILTRCVNPCPPVFIRVGISIQKPIDSYLGKTRPAVLNIWSFPTNKTRR